MTDTNSYYMELWKPPSFPPSVSVRKLQKTEFVMCPVWKSLYSVRLRRLMWRSAAFWPRVPAREKGPVSSGGERVQIITPTDPEAQRLSSPPPVQVNTNKSEEAKAIMAARDPGSLWPLLLFKPYRWHDVKNEPLSSRVPISEWAHYLPFFTLNLLPACSGRCSGGVTHFYGLLTAVLF